MIQTLTDGVPLPLSFLQGLVGAIWSPFVLLKSHAACLSLNLCPENKHLLNDVSIKA